MEILQTLEPIKDDPNEKSAARHEAAVLLRQLKRLETASMVALWSFLLGRFNATSQKLQSVSMDVSMVTELYGALIQLAKDTRDCFEEYEQKGKLLSGIDTYEYDMRRTKKRKIQFDEAREVEVRLSGRDHFRVNTFNVILDNTICELERRRGAYEVFLNRFQVENAFQRISLSYIYFSEQSPHIFISGAHKYHLHVLQFSE
jgi:hypothetical protein